MFGNNRNTSNTPKMYQIKVPLTFINRQCIHSFINKKKLKNSKMKNLVISF